jgi:hypothetical protein
MKSVSKFLRAAVCVLVAICKSGEIAKAYALRSQNTYGRVSRGVGV